MHQLERRCRARDHSLGHLAHELHHLHNGMRRIMATLQEVQDEIVALKADAQADHDSDAAAFAALKVQIDALTAAAAAGATPAQLDAIVAGLKDVQAIIVAPNA